jgi:hypothetical protein
MASALLGIFGGGTGNVLDGAAHVINAIKGKNPEDAAKLEQIHAELSQLQLKYKADFDLAQLEMQRQREANESSAMHDQVEVNKIEAGANGDGTFWGNAVAFWKSGWRPFCGWVCGLAFLIEFVIGPCWSFWEMLHGRKLPFPELNSQMLTTLLFGLLGLAGARSFDKTKGTSS